MLKVKDSNGVDLAAVDGSIGTDQISFTSSAGSTVITISPPDGLVYTPGAYTLSFGRYAKSSDASKVVASSNKFSYLNAVSKQISFTVVRIETPCDRGEVGYFELTNSNGTTECIELPEVSFTFTPSGGSELTHPNADPTTVIKIKFDSEVVFIDSSGWSNITKQKLLDMIEISLKSGGSDLVRSGGAIDTDELSVTHLGGRTTITINPPDNRTYTSSQNANFYNLLIDSYAKKQDASKITQSNSISSYLQASMSSYQDQYDGFWTLHWPTSCDVEYRQPSAYDQEDEPGFVCGTDTLDLPDFPFKDLGDNRLFQIAADRADPNETYQIDVAFIISDHYLGLGSLNFWRSEIQDNYIPAVNDMYQKSGVNVELRAVAVRPFSEFRQHLLCPGNVPSLDNLIVTGQGEGSHGQQPVLQRVGTQDSKAIWC